MSKYEPQPVMSFEDAYRELQRLSIAVGQQFDNEVVWERFIPQLSSDLSASTPDMEQYTAIGNVRTFAFDGVGDETVYFNIQLPQSWQQGTSLKPYVHFTAKSATTNATVIWQLEYTIANRGTILGASTNLSATLSVSAAHFIHSLSLGEISATSGTTALMLIGSLTRRGSADTYANDVALVSLEIHYQRDGTGSVKEFDKYGS